MPKFIHFVIFFCLCSFSSCVILKYPTYKQCDPRWGNDTMGKTGPSNTICAQGCAISSISSGLASHNLTIPVTNSDINPGSFNEWVKLMGGYICISNDCSNLNLTMIPSLAPVNLQYLGEQSKPTESELSTLVTDSHQIITAHVRSDTHFVLLTGKYISSNHSFSVMDPYYPNLWYTYDDISDLIRYYFIAIKT